MASGDEVFEYGFDEEDELEDKNEEVKKVAEFTRNPESVITESLNPILAFQTFGGKIFDPSATETESHSKSVQVYSTGTPEKFESPLQKFRRLKQELTLFEQELEQLGGHSPSERDAIPALTRSIKGDLDGLWSQLERKKTQNPELFTETLKNETEISTDTLMNELRRFQALNLTDTSEDGGAHAVYSLFRGHDINTSEQSLSEIQERIDRIESVLGQAPEAGFSYHDMSSGISFLVRNMQLIEGNKLESILKKVETINQKMSKLTKEEAAEQAENLTLQAKRDRVNETYEKLEKWDVASQDLPVVITRLKELKVVHDESADILNKMNGLREQQKRLERILEEDRKLLKQAQDSLSQNARIMTDSVQALDGRIQALLARIPVPTS